MSIPTIFVSKKYHYKYQNDICQHARMTELSYILNADKAWSNGYLPHIESLETIMWKHRQLCVICRKIRNDFHMYQSKI